MDPRRLGLVYCYEELGEGEAAVVKGGIGGDGLFEDGDGTGMVAGANEEVGQKHGDAVLTGIEGAGGT